MSQDDSQLRLFFALWPDPETRRQLDQIYRNLLPTVQTGSAVAAENLHLTLHFLGSVSSKRADCFIRQAKLVSSSSFRLVLDHVDCFPKAKVLWAGAGAVPRELLQLHSRLNQQIASCGFRMEERRFQPHISLARKLQKLPDSHRIDPISWWVDRFALVRSISTGQGVRYEPMKLFRLQAGLESAG
jgi:2'-5' RNA ligase